MNFRATCGTNFQCNIIKNEINLNFRLKTDDFLIHIFASIEITRLVQVREFKNGQGKSWNFSKISISQGILTF